MDKFLERDHSDEEYFAKLGEEFGEVAQERLKSVRGLLKNTMSLEEELEHLEQVAKAWRKALRIERNEGVGFRRL